MIRVLLAADQAILRAGLRALVENEPDMTVVGECALGPKTLAMIEQSNPDVALLDGDVSHPLLLAMAENLAASGSAVRMVILYSQGRLEFIRAAFKAGVYGLVSKGSHMEELSRSILKVHEGFRYASPEVASILVEQVIGVNQGTGQPHRPFRLPRRKLEVLKLVASGMNTKEVAHHLGIATKTADAHRRDLMEQLQLRTVADLTRFAIRNGLAEL